MSGALLVSVHDVASSTGDATRRWLELLEPWQIPTTLLVVPGPWEGASLRRDAGLCAWLTERERAGDEIAQHGWTHRAPAHGPWWRRAVGSMVARGCAEFAALDEAEATRRLEWGRSVLQDLGFDPTGVTPPGWLISPAGRRAVAQLGYRYVASQTGIHDVVLDVQLRAPALSHRSGAASEAVGAQVVARVSRRLAYAGRTVRIALHPADLANPALVDITLSAVDEALAAGARPTTYAQLVHDACLASVD